MINKLHRNRTLETIPGSLAIAFSDLSYTEKNKIEDKGRTLTVYIPYNWIFFF
jgi:hypothetical protein